MILVDSCVYIRLLRADLDPARELAGLAMEDELATCGVIRCEVLRGMRTAKARKALAAYLDCLLYIPTLNTIWEKAENLLWDLDRTGFHIPLPDAVIAASALHVGATVLTFDGHFQHVPDLVVRDEYET